MMALWFFPLLTKAGKIDFPSFAQKHPIHMR
jgi:hypothetical protein